MLVFQLEMKHQNLKWLSFWEWWMLWWGFYSKLSLTFDWVCFIWPHVTDSTIALGNSSREKKIRKSVCRKWFVLHTDSESVRLAVNGKRCNRLACMFVLLLSSSSSSSYSSSATSQYSYQQHTIKYKTGVSILRVQLIYDWSVNTFSFLCFILGQHQ